jgi:3',5'-cyclic AMP phosphodiesterase CpdA
VGSREEPRIEPGLAALIDQIGPELIIASGDLTHRGRPEQHDRAADFLRSLGRPVLAVPGNHDIPYTPIARFTRTYEQFERHWETTEPIYRSGQLHVVGLNSVRPWRPPPPPARSALAFTQETGQQAKPRPRRPR